MKWIEWRRPRRRQWKKAGIAIFLGDCFECVDDNDEMCCSVALLCEREFLNAMWYCNNSDLLLVFLFFGNCNDFSFYFLIFRFVGVCTMIMMFNEHYGNFGLLGITYTHMGDSTRIGRKVESALSCVHAFRHSKWNQESWNVNANNMHTFFLSYL